MAGPAAGAAPEIGIGAEAGIEVGPIAEGNMLDEAPGNAVSEEIDPEGIDWGEIE